MQSLICFDENVFGGIVQTDIPILRATHTIFACPVELEGIDGTCMAFREYF